MASRRDFLKATGTAGALGTTGLAGCLGDLTGGDTATSKTTSSSTEEVRFILTPAESDVDVKKQYAGVFNYIESEADVTVTPKVAGDYPAVYQALKSDQADVADASPTLGVVGTNNDVVDIAGIRVAFGAAKYFSLITTTPDSGIEDLSDLEGETVAFADKLSTSGSLFPLYGLKQAGLDIGGAPNGNPQDFTGKWSTHDQAVSQLLNREEIKAAGSGAFVAVDKVPKDQFPERFEEMAAGYDDAGSADEQLDLLHTSDPIPRAPILTRSNWDSSAKSDVETALVDAEKEDLQGSEADEGLWFTGITDGDASDYEPVAKVKNNLGLEFGN